MRKALALVAVAALTVGVTGTSTAAVKKPKPKPKPLPKAVPLVVPDAAGDANGINDQSGLLPAAPPEQSTPQGQRGAADILSFTISRLDDTKTISGLVFTVKLTAAPDRATGYRIQVATPACAQNLFSYYVDPTGAATAFVRELCSPTDKTTPLTGVKVNGTDLVFTVPFKEMPSTIKLGTQLSDIQAYSTGLVAASGASLAFPTIDQTKISDSYKVGQ